MTSSAQQCPDCGAPIPEGAPFGACPACLVQSALGTEETDLPSSAESKSSPDHIGPYRLLRKLGEGGFGEVYEAEQSRPVQRRVALKLLKRGMDTKQVVARFEAERQALALMDHPHVATVYEAGESSDGRPFFVMELVDGKPITEFCEQSELSLRDRLELFIQVCEGVQHAHSKGIIHRDLKPSNVLVALKDGRPVPKVIDFGVAKATDQILTPKTIFTEQGGFVGTPAYMSPEQAVGKIDIDTRSDVYSLGVLLYELLTRHTPFEDQELRSEGYAAMERILREEMPLKPSTRLTTAGSDRRTASRLRGDLDWIVMKTLEKDSDRRYATALGLARDVRRHLTCEAVEAGPPSRLYLLNRFARRNKTLIGATAGIVLTLLLGIIVSTRQAVRATRAEREASHQAERAQLAEQDARSEAAVGESVTSFLTDRVVAAAFEDGIPDVRKIVAVMLRAEQELTELDHQPLVQAGGYLIMGRMYLWSGFPGKAKPTTGQSLALYRQEMGPTHEKTLQAFEDYLRVLLALKSYGEIEAELGETLPLIEESLGGSHPRISALLQIKQLCLAHQGSLNQRAVVLLRMLEHNFLLQSVWRDLRDAYVALSLDAFEKGRNEEALEQMVRASIFASVHNRGGYWHDSLTITLPVRQKFIQAGVAPKNWTDFTNVLSLIEMDQLAADLSLPAPAEAMIKAYLFNHRGDPGASVTALRPLAERFPSKHALQHAFGYYLEESGLNTAVDAYFAAALLAAERNDAPALHWYASNWDRLRRKEEIPLPAREIPRSNPVRDPDTGHLYQRLEIPLSWRDARVACQQLGGQLAIISNERENNLVYSRLATAHSCWLGASVESANSGWSWVDGTSLEFENWEGDRPPTRIQEPMGLVIGNTAPFRIFGLRYAGLNPGSTWIPRPATGLAKSVDYEDPLRNSLFLFAICEWESEGAWRDSTANTN